MHSTNGYILSALTFLFHLQSDRDVSILGKEKYDVLRNDVINKLPSYFDMYDYNEHKSLNDVDAGLTIEFTMDGWTYTLEYGTAHGLGPPYPLNDNLNYKWLPKDKDMVCDILTQFNVTIGFKATAKPITINFVVTDDEDDPTEDMMPDTFEALDGNMCCTSIDNGVMLSYSPEEYLTRSKSVASLISIFNEFIERDVAIMGADTYSIFRSRVFKDMVDYVMNDGYAFPCSAIRGLSLHFHISGKEFIVQYSAQSHGTPPEPTIEDTSNYNIEGGRLEIYVLLNPVV